MIRLCFQACIYWKITCNLTTWIAAIHFFYNTVIISRQLVKQSIMSRALCLFHNTCCSRPLKQVVCGLFRNIWKVLCLFEETKCLYLRLSCINVNAFPLFHSEWINLIISQYSKIFRRAIDFIRKCCKIKRTVTFERLVK